MKIQITLEDIEKGTPCNSYDCPAALAIQRALNTKNVSVRDSFVQVFDPAPYRRHVPTPQALKEFIEALDNSEGPKPGPIEFELDIAP